MRIIILFILCFTSFLAARAQSTLPFNGTNDLQTGVFNRHQLLNDSVRLQQKWSVSGYAGIGTGIGFFNGGNTSFLPVQLGLQLNHRLNNNLYAFAGVGVTPVYFNVNRSFNSIGPSKNYMLNNGFNNHGWGISPGLQAGLMYVNDARTFSISGSIGVSSSNYSFYPTPRVSSQKPAPVAGARQ
ncbi:MAG: hypothetical protein ABIU63_07565 [Chitinophagaceae bacterium]